MDYRFLKVKVYLTLILFSSIACKDGLLRTWQASSTVLFYMHVYFTYDSANPNYRLLLFPFYTERETEALGS